MNFACRRTKLLVSSLGGGILSRTAVVLFLLSGLAVFSRVKWCFFSLVEMGKMEECLGSECGACYCTSGL